MKKKIKFFISTALSICMLITPVTSKAGGIPTFDGASLAQAILQVIHMKEQIDNQIKQITQMKKQLEAVTGSRDIGKTVGIVADQLPTEWQSIYNSTGNTDYKKQINGKEYSPETALKQLVQDHNMSIQAFNDTKTRLTNIQKMIQKIDSTKDLKESQDLQNRIAAESAIIQNNQTKLDMMARLATQQEKLEHFKQADRSKCHAQNYKTKNWKACQ